MKDLEKMGFRTEVSKSEELSREDIEAIFANALADAREKAKTLLEFGAPELSPDSKAYILKKVESIPLDRHIEEVLFDPEPYDKNWPKSRLIQGWAAIDVSRAIGECMDEFSSQGKDRKQQVGLFEFGLTLALLLKEGNNKKI